MPTLPSRCWLLLLLALPLVAALGCGPGVADVKGTIKLNGQPPQLKGLEIAFLSPRGKLVTAPIQSDGTYVASGVPAGDAKISFVFAPPVDGVDPKKRRLVKPTDTRPTPPANPIPVPLRDASTSQLSLKVASSGNVFDYDIKP
jgi:hypothetical protein